MARLFSPKARSSGKPYQSHTADRRDDPGAAQPPLPMLRNFSHGTGNSTREGREQQPFDGEDEAESSNEISHFAARPVPATHQLFAGGAGVARDAEG
jgi:hypothetical protein